LKAAVVILNWNGRKFLEKFLPGVIRHSAGFAEVIVADNDSRDGSVAFLEEAHPEVRVIRFPKNYGFAGGYNKAFGLIEADYYILLNSDIEVTEDWISPVIRLMESDPGIAACQPKILSYHEPANFEYAGAAGGFIDRYGYPFCRGRIFQVLEEDQGQYDDDTEVFWATGACMFVRASCFREAGGFDEEFFAHMEEIDFCWRMRNMGYRIMVCPGSKIYHIGGGTLPKNNAQKTYLNIRNNIIMLYKNLEPCRLFPVFTTRFFLDAVAAVKFLLDGGFPDLWAVFRAHSYFWRNLRRLRSKRKILPHLPVRKIYQGNIVAEHYLRRIKHFSDLDPGRFS
jgi:hypothetical protein